MKPDLFASAQALFRRVSDSLLKEDKDAVGEDAARQKRRRVVVLGVGGVLIACLAIWAVTHLGQKTAPKPTEAERAQAISVTPLGMMEFSQTINLEGEA